MKLPVLLFSLLMLTQNVGAQGNSTPSSDGPSLLGSIMNSKSLYTRENVIGNILKGALENMHFSGKEINNDLSKNAFKEMNKTIVKCLSFKEVGGYGFNQMSKETNKNFFEKIKNSKFINFIGFYSNKPGKVLKSGWHSKILNVKKNTYVDWVYTTACIYKTEAIRNLKFDENFGQYSYLEDLDFSLNLKKLKKKIVISYLAKFTHPHNIDRSSLIFGITEIINRFRIVKKHELNLCFFFIVSLLRFIISLINSLFFNLQYFLRAIGNIVGFFKIITSLFKTSKIK
jgi:GT2 family glycosyltransferase